MRDRALEAKAKALESIREAVEPTLIAWGFTWEQAQGVFSLVYGVRDVLKMITELETLPFKIAIAITMEGMRPLLEPEFAEKGISWEQAVTMVVRAGTMPIGIATVGPLGAAGNVQGMTEVNALAQNPSQFAHSFLAASGAASKRFLPDCFDKKIDSYLIHEAYLEIYYRDGTSTFDGTLPFSAPYVPWFIQLFYRLY